MMIHQTSREQLEELQISSSGEYSQIYKAVSRPRVNESIEQNFIKVILTKDQKRDKRNKG